MSRKSLIVTGLIVLFWSVVLYNIRPILYTIRKWDPIGPGSYVFAEQYDLGYSEQEVLNAVKDFKRLYPSYDLPKNSEYRLVNEMEDEWTDERKLWFRVNFYYPKEKYILFCTVRGPKPTTIGFVSMATIEDFSWLDINKDFDYDENQLQLKTFEDRILSKLKVILEKNRVARVKQASQKK